MTKKSLICAAICMCTLVGCGQEKKDNENASPAAVVIKATFDKTGQHPGTTAVQGPTPVTCLSASGGGGKCNIAAPGYFGDIAPGTQIGTSGAGTVTLNCSGTGNYLACSAKVGQ